MEFIRKKYKTFQGYTPGMQPDDPLWIKLNTNENPYPVSPRVEQLLRGFNVENLKKYPSFYGEPLRSAIAQKYSLPENRIVITNGSDESLALIFLALFEETDRINTPKLTYSLYPVLSHIYGGYINDIRFDDQFCVTLEDLDKDSGSRKAKAVILPNPNAPTGQFFHPSELLKKISTSEKIWIIDEAYADFAETEKTSLLDFSEKLLKLKNVIVTRTFSKSYSLAGMRIGYMVIPDEDLASYFYHLKDSYNEDTLSLLIGKTALEDEAFLRKNIDKINSTKKRVVSELAALGFMVLPSQANFILVKPEYTTASDYYQALLKEKILIRYFDMPLLSNYVRVSIGSDSEMDQLLEATRRILNV